MNAVSLKLSDAQYAVLRTLLRDVVENTAPEDLAALTNEALPMQSLETQHAVFWDLVADVEAISRD